MDVRPILTDEDHTAALAEIERLWGSAVGSPEGDRLDVLVALVKAYEDARWSIEIPNPMPARPQG
jgi:HTH-type transcriptional regulator/antitoxin HigA